MNRSIDRAFQGKDEKGIWHQFEWSLREDPTPESTGYEEIEEITFNSRMDDESKM